MDAHAVVTHPAPAKPGPAELPVSAKRFAEIVLNRPVRAAFTYRIPPEWMSILRPGMRVLVPFGKRREVGVCVGLSASSSLPGPKIKDLFKVLDTEPILDPQLLELTRWLADYYVASWGEALAAVLPPPLKRDAQRKTSLWIELVEGAESELAHLEKKFERQFRLLRTLIEANGSAELGEFLRRTGLSMSPVQSLVKRGLVQVVKKPIVLDPLDQAPIEASQSLTLNAAQQSALQPIQAALHENRFQSFLLFGVTGSGKTEVYLQAMASALEAGRSAMILVPEISLTPQTVGRFRARFSDVAVLHSHLTDSQRLQEWKRIQEGKVRVVVGARSAVFAPLQNLGLIIVDEEHEPSFKQQNAPRYHARDVAVYRAHLAKAVVVLGSATPSLESYWNAKSGKYQLLELPDRVMGGALPPIHLVDLKQEVAEQKSYVVFSRLLINALQSALDKKEQAILFLNRRGFSPVIFCRQCGMSVRCRRCDVSMSYHQRIRRLVCHSCCEERLPPKECLECSSTALLFLGTGSEKVELRLAELFPNARIARMDSDTMVKRGSYEDVLQRFRNQEIDLLVGTQMIAKGLDFPNVTVVGVISADTSLHVPDFRASERSFQLIAQVAGRAGRGPKGGAVIVQSAMEGHEAIQAAIDHDFVGFAKRELEHRRPLGYPPFGRVVRILIEGKDESRVRHAAQQIRASFGPKLTPGLQLLGPAAAPISKLRDRYRWHLLLKIVPAEKLREVRSRLHEIATQNHAGVKVAVDVDPISML